MMTRERYVRLARDGASLTLQEMIDGWHYCPEWDYDLMLGESLDPQHRCDWCNFDPRMAVTEECA